MRSFINIVATFILFVVVFLTGTTAQAQSCADGVIPPEFVVPGPNGPVFHDNTFLLYEPAGCEAAMRTFIRITNKLPGTCLVPHWQGSAMDTRVIMDAAGTLVPVTVRDQNGRQVSCLEYGQSAWTIAKTTSSRIGGDAYGNVKVGVNPGVRDQLPNGYPTINVGLALATPTGLEPLPSPLQMVCQPKITLMADRFDHTRDFVTFTNAWCSQVQ